MAQIRLPHLPVEKLTLSAADGHPLAAHRFAPAGEVRGTVVFGPAMAVPQAFYHPFAEHLAMHGYAAWTFDYRGMGDSLTGALSRVKADIGDWLRLDYDAVLRHAGGHMPGLPLFLVGHSLGGQIAPLLPSRARVAGLLNIAVGSGYIRHNTPSLRRRAPLMWYGMVPLLVPLLGYFPGARLGVIGNLPAGAMYQWRRWCLSPEYLLSGEPGAREAYASADFPVLALTFSDDELLIEPGSRLLHDAYRKRVADYRVVNPADHGMRRIGHFGFFKPQSATALWPLALQWLNHHSTNGAR